MEPFGSTILDTGAAGSGGVNSELAARAVVQPVPPEKKSDIEFLSETTEKEFDGVDLLCADAGAATTGPHATAPPGERAGRSACSPARASGGGIPPRC